MSRIESSLNRPADGDWGANYCAATRRCRDARPTKPTYSPCQFSQPPSVVHSPLVLQQAEPQQP